jgi:PAS domain S-box-containing protein
LITVFVALVVMATTLANVAHLAGVIIGRTQQEAAQAANQIAYALQQELAEAASSGRDPYASLAGERSRVRGLMESTLVTSPTITYLYVSNLSGQIMRDAAGQNELAANRYMIGDLACARADLNELVGASRFGQLVGVLIGDPIYEFRERLESSERGFAAHLHIGVSASAVRRELWSPIATNLIIGLLALVWATVVAISSANLLLKPLRAISTSIDRLELDGAPQLDEVRMPRDEVVTGVTGKLKQLSARLAGERSELEIMRGRLRQVISHLEDRLLLINRDGRVILASPDAERLVGLSNTELTGLHIAESLGAAHPLVPLVERALAEKRSIGRTSLRVQNGGETRQLIASIQYIEDAGEPVGALASLRDAESIRKYESQWDLSKKLADLGRITSGIAHEVKNPLNAMVIHLEILRSKIESGTGDPTSQLEILDSEIKRLDRVVQTFLNFTRPLDLRLEPLDLNVLVGQVIELAATEAAERNVMIKRELAPDPLVAKVDADMLKQALLNIIINGCQAMPEGGPLRVATSQGDGMARITIADRGVGIAPDARDRIFSLYYTTKKDGTGIGLAQAFRAVQLHNGTISFNSEVGVGTSFVITLPVEP